MKNFQEIYKELAAKKTRVKKVNSWVGCDGTVDKIVAAVDKRHGTGEKYTPIPTIAQWGERISAAAGRSTNIELYLRQEKIGGNAAIMAGALAATGAPVTLVADLGKPKINGVFASLAKKAKLVSLGEPTETHAVEFADGKVMLGYTKNHEAITFKNIEKASGGPAKLVKLIDNMQLVALVNWTMAPGMTEIYKEMIKKVLPKINLNRNSKEKDRKIFFFDLADPEKRSQKELAEALGLIGKFDKWGRAVLGVNFKEAQQVSNALGLPQIDETDNGLKQAAENIRKKLGLSCVVIHTIDAAAAAHLEKGQAWVRGPYVKAPKITTGAGDHFNAGFALGLATESTLEAALALGVAFSGSYVRTGKSPKMEDALALIKKGW